MIFGGIRDHLAGCMPFIEYVPSSWVGYPRILFLCLSIEMASECVMLHIIQEKR